jgi:hypothetical protein
VAGDVAPVSKTVVYNTLSGIPGESTKCWIMSNLGSDNQATAKNDVTEASAGWYWQFNKKQGYKHDGTERTPNTAWITNIDEDQDWIAANDPCTIELANGWRIPTRAEWTNVKNSSLWTNWNGPWNSPLRIHAAGRIGSDGTLNFRGEEGNYWSGIRTNSSNAYHLQFNSTTAVVGNESKARGESVRCVRE